MARTNLDKILVVDLEATCWASGGPPKDQQSDIIEVGICELDLRTLQPGRKEGVLIKPSRSTISWFCTDLTTIDDETLKGAQDFNSAMNYIVNTYRPKHRIWAAWGEFDRTRMESECAEKSATYPFGYKYINIKSLFSLALGLQKEYGLARALKRIGLDMKGTHHRGVDDAYNTARILAEIFKKSRGLA